MVLCFSDFSFKNNSKYFFHLYFSSQWKMTITVLIIQKSAYSKSAYSLETGHISCYSYLTLHYKNKIWREQHYKGTCTCFSQQCMLSWKPRLEFIIFSPWVFLSHLLLKTFISEIDFLKIFYNIPVLKSCTFTCRIYTSLNSKLSCLLQQEYLPGIFYLSSSCSLQSVIYHTPYTQA